MTTTPSATPIPASPNEHPSSAPPEETAAASPTNGKPGEHPDYTVQKRRKRGTRRFYLLTLLIYLPALYVLASIQARWYGFVAVALSFGLLLAMRRSRAWRSWRIPLCMTAAVVSAFLGVYAAQPTRQVSLTGQIASGTVRIFGQSKVANKVFTLDSAETGGALWKVPEGYTLQGVRMQNCTAEWLRADAGARDRLILQLHGGAFELGIYDMYRTMAVRYSKAAGGADVLTVEYRLWPEYAYPAQQDDALAAWDCAVNTLGYQPQNISVVGDSAGGNLALSLCLRLRDRGGALPRSVVCLSPWADLSNSGPSHVENARVDVMFGIGDDEGYDGSPLGVDSTYADALDPQAPDVSPSFGDYAGCPPLLVQVGGDELLLSDSQMVKDACDAAGTDCTLHVFPGMYHVFQASPYAIPECEEAWQEIAAFLQK